MLAHQLFIQSIFEQTQVIVFNNTMAIAKVKNNGNSN